MTGRLTGAPVFRTTQANTSPSTAPQISAATKAVTMPVAVNATGKAPPALSTRGISRPKITQTASMNINPLVIALTVGIYSYMAPKTAPMISPMIAMNSNSVIIAEIETRVSPVMGTMPPKTDRMSTTDTSDARPISASNIASTPIMIPVMMPAMAPSPISLVDI